MEGGSLLSIGDSSNLEVVLVTNDENGFDLGEAAVLHYRVKAGEAEISRGSVLLPDTTSFGQQYYWSGMLDLTDSGATTLLPSYTVDVWVSGSDEAGNPYDTVSNSMDDPFSSWPMALLGPRVDLQHENTTLQWDVPSPYRGNNATMVVNTPNLGGDGDVMFALQELVDGGFWATVATVGLKPRVAPRWSPRCRWSQKHRQGPASSTVSSFWSTTSRWTDTRWTRSSSRKRRFAMGKPSVNSCLRTCSALLSLSSLLVRCPSVFTRWSCDAECLRRRRRKRLLTKLRKLLPK